LTKTHLIGQVISIFKVVHFQCVRWKATEMYPYCPTIGILAESFCSNFLYTELLKEETERRFHLEYRKPD